METNCTKRPLVVLLIITAIGGLTLRNNMVYSEETAFQVTTTEKRQGKELVKGEVLKVDNDIGEIIIKHEKLTDLGMPAMTMVFKVSDRSLLEHVKAGKKVRFAAQTGPHGLLVTKIETESDFLGLGTIDGTGMPEE